MISPPKAGGRSRIQKAHIGTDLGKQQRGRVSNFKNAAGSGAKSKNEELEFDF